MSFLVSQIKVFPVLLVKLPHSFLVLFFKNDYDLIQSIIEIFRKEKTRHVELVATLYSCWMELSNKNMAVNEQSILNSLYNWSPEKKKFTENEVIDTYNWMMVNNFVPSK